MKFPLRLLAGLFILILLLSGCNQGATSSPATAVATLAPTATTPASIAQPASLSREEAILTTVNVVKILSPSVVQVQTEAATIGFFGQPVPETGVGTGIIVDSSGHILTNNHVVQSARQITVSLSTGQSFKAQIIGTDPSTDLAVIKIEATGLQPAKLGDSSVLQVGEDVIAIGHALGLPGGPTVSTGVVSALDRSIQVDRQSTADGLIQTDAAINPGNSGGPLANHRGEVIGVNTAIIPQSQGIGFAININDAKFVMAHLIEKGIVERAFLGIAHVNVTPAIAQNMGLSLEGGVGIVQVVPGSGAERAGLREGDILVKMGDQELKSPADLLRFLSKHKAGETVEISYYRSTTRRTGQVTLGTRPES